MLKNFCLISAIIIGYFISTTINQLVLQACCKGNQNCRKFQRPEEMFGISCCGVNPLNDFEEICCDNVTQNRKQGGGFVNRCCGNQTLRYDQTCCQGIVHNVPNGECCGTQAYARNTYNVLCCNGTLHTKVDPGKTCCGNNPFDGGITESCCGGQVSLKELFDGCCPILNSKPPQYKQFNLRTHLCCDVPIGRESNMKCCYLRNSNGTFTPKSYDYTTNCCAYPYTSITPKSGNSCIADATAPPAIEGTTARPEGTTLTGQSTSASPNPNTNTNANTTPSDNNGDNEEDN